jgi:hypothetical protein
MGFTSVGIGSTANYGFLQFFGTSNTLCWTANGTVGIGRTNPRFTLDVNGGVSIGNRFLGSVDGSNVFWMGLNGTGTEAERLAISLTGDATTGAVSGITLRQNTSVNGVITKLGTTTGYDTRIEGGTNTNSGYVNFIVNNLSSGYIGNASATDMDIVAQNGTKLNFYTAGTNNFRINTSGNLEMNILKSFYLYYSSPTNNAGLVTNLSGDVSIFTGISNPSNRLTITAGGNVGIGATNPDSGYTTTIPNAKLTIRGGTAGQNGGSSRLSIGGDNSHYSAIEGTHVSGGATTLAFMTCLNAVTNSANPETRLFINSSGNVGIGTTTVNYPLQIGSAGSIIRIGGLINAGSSANTTVYGLERSRNQIQFSTYRDVLSDKIGAKIVAINKQTYIDANNRHLIQSTDLAFFTVPPDANDLDSTAERVRITDTGNVGIGTAAPGYQLSVGNYAGMMGGVSFTFTAPASSIDTGLVLPAGGTYLVTIVTSGNDFANNNQWVYCGMVLFNSSAVAAFILSTLYANNMFITCGTNGRVMLTISSGTGLHSATANAIRLC